MTPAYLQAVDLSTAGGNCDIRWKPGTRKGEGAISQGIGSDEQPRKRGSGTTNLPGCEATVAMSVHPSHEEPLSTDARGHRELPQPCAPQTCVVEQNRNYEQAHQNPFFILVRSRRNYMSASRVTRNQAYLTTRGGFFILLTWRPLFTIYIHYHKGAWDKAVRICQFGIFIE